MSKVAHERKSLGVIPFTLEIVQIVKDEIVIGGDDGSVGHWLDSLIDSSVSQGESLGKVTVDLSELFVTIMASDPAWDSNNRDNR